MRHPPAALAAAALALVLPILSTPIFVAPAFSSRYIVIVFLAAIGPALVIRSLVSGRSGDVVALSAFVAWAALATAAANEPAQAFWGIFGLGTGLVFVLALASMYLIGRAAGRDSRLVQQGLLVAVLANATVAIAQAIFDLSRMNYELFDGRATGLLGNPVFLGGLLSGGFWLAVRYEFRHWWASAVTATAVASGINLSGSRIALLALVLAVMGATTVGRRTFATAAAAAVTGVAIASIIVSTSGTRGADRGVAGLDRIGSSSGVSARSETWSYSWDAFLERPIAGAGPGRFKAATMPHRTLDFIMAEGPDAYFADAHNFLVEYAVTTGGVGLVLLVTWGVLAFRRANLRSPLSGFAALVLFTTAAEPQNAGVTPLVLLALGTAASGGIWQERRRWTSAVVAVSALGGGVTAAVIAVGLWSLNEARLDFDLSAARRADALLPPWSVAPEQVARVFLLRSLERRDPALKLRTLEYRRKAAADDPEDPGPMVVLADFEIQLDRKEEAKAHLDQALQLDRWRTHALNARGRLAAEDGDFDLAVRLLRRSTTADPSQRGIIGLLETIESGDFFVPADTRDGGRGP